MQHIFSKIFIGSHAPRLFSIFNISTIVLSIFTLSLSAEDAFQRQLERERAETYVPEDVDEQRYYDATGQHDPDANYNYLLKPHPIQEAPLDERPIE